MLSRCRGGLSQGEDSRSLFSLQHIKRSYLNSPSYVWLSRTFSLAYPKCYFFSTQIKTPSGDYFVNKKGVLLTGSLDSQITHEKGYNAFFLKMHVYITTSSF